MKTLYPLRKVVSEKNDQYGRIIEVLECGHEQAQKEDHYGPTNAYKRRCRRCAAKADGNDEDTKDLARVDGASIAPSLVPQPAEE